MTRLTGISKKIVEKYRPDCIIMFEQAPDGSGGTNHVDLVILKETLDSPSKRRADVESLTGQADIAFDVVIYTSDELKYLYSVGNPFVHSVMKEGRLLYTRKATGLWVSDAREEFESAKVLCGHGMYRPACYHSRRAIEKGLHALIMSKAKKPGATDELMELYNYAKALGFKSGLTEEDIVFVSSFSKHKYPVERALLPHFKPGREDAERAIDCARRLIERIDSLRTK